MLVIRNFWAVGFDRIRTRNKCFAGADDNMDRTLQ